MEKEPKICEVCAHPHEGKLCDYGLPPDGDMCCCDAYMYDYDAHAWDDEEFDEEIPY